MAELIANKALKYKTRRLLPGDRFEAHSRRDESMFILTKQASYAPPAVETVDELKVLRDEYFKVFDKRPFMGWDAETLREKIAEHKG